MKDDKPESLYTIVAKPVDKNAVSSTDSVVSAKPIDLKFFQPPALGEIVLLFLAPNPYSDAGYKIKEYYYISAINLQSSLNHNALPKISETSQQSNTSNANGYSNANKGVTKSNPSGGSHKLGETIKEKSMNPLQAFEGDTLLQSRWGSSIRLSSNVSGGGIYSQQQPWTGTAGEPILVITNGHGTTSGTNKFITEDATTDASSIYLTKKAKLNKFQPANSNYGLGVTPANTYDKPQLLATSDRILLHSRTDYIILDGKKSVNVITPKWAMDMDKLFTILEGVLQQLADLGSGTATFSTGAGPTGPSTNVAQINQLLTELKQMAQ
jgi:hypothetical protein